MITILICITLLSCGSNIDERIYGDWEVSNRFYQANYRVDNVDDKIMGKVLSYNDGTMKYKWDDKNPKYIFQNLKQKDTLLVDAISGATAKAENRNIEIQILHEDTLSTTIFINNHPQLEIWTRINTK